MRTSATTSSCARVRRRSDQIAENAGQDGGVVVSKVVEGKGNFGYDALKEEYTDLVKAGIIDPTKVTRYALQNAASVSTLLLTSDALDRRHAQRTTRRRPAAAAMAGMTICIDRLVADPSEALWGTEVYPRCPIF